MVTREEIKKGIKLYKGDKEYTVDRMCPFHIHLSKIGIVHNRDLGEYTLQPPCEVKDGVIHINIDGLYTFKFSGSTCNGKPFNFEVIKQ